MRGGVAVVALLSMGCVGPSSTACVDGLRCADGETCLSDLGMCVDSRRVEACAGLDQGDVCNLEQGQGSCIAGVCSVGCGDRVIIAPEQCEGTDFGGASCQSLGFYGGELACSECSFDLTQCAGYCGDRITNGPEQCDGTGFASCTSLGAAFGVTACADACYLDRTHCGVIDTTYEAADVVVELQRIWGADENNVFAIGSGVVTHYHDGHWTRLTLPTSNVQLRAVHGRSAAEVYVVGEPGSILKYDGSEFSTIPFPGDGALTSVWATPTALFVGTAEGKLHRMDSSGWTSFDLGQPVVEL